MKLTQIQPRGFRAFAGELNFSLPDGCNLLLHGENGSGKSSLSCSLREFFTFNQDSPLTPTKKPIIPYRHSFPDTNPTPKPRVAQVKLTFTDAANPSATIAWDESQLHLMEAGDGRQPEPATPAQRAELSAIVGQVLSAKRAGSEALVQSLEGEIDAIVFRLYALTPEEIALVQSATGSSAGASSAPASHTQSEAKALSPYFTTAARATLYNRVLAELKTTSPYFTTAAITRRVQQLDPAINLDSLAVYLSESTTAGLIHSAGRGWYSRLSEPVLLDSKPVAKLVRAVEKAFPLLDFTVWSTTQINPWMHHLLAQPVNFLYAPADTLESVGDTLRAQGWEIAVDPGKKEGPKLVHPGEKMLVLRPTHSKQPAPVGRQARIEQLLVELQLEAARLALMDTTEALGVIREILSRNLVQLSELKMYADFRTLKLYEIEAFN